MNLLDAGQHEPLKHAVHRTAELLFGVMTLYNACAFVKRREMHLLLNAFLYLLLTGWEDKQAGRHR